MRTPEFYYIKFYYIIILYTLTVTVMLLASSKYNHPYPCRALPQNGTSITAIERHVKERKVSQEINSIGAQLKFDMTEHVHDERLQGKTDVVSSII